MFTETRLHLPPRETAARYRIGASGGIRYRIGASGGIRYTSTPPTKTVRASRTPTKGQEPGVVQTGQNSGFVRSLVKRLGTVAYISNGVEHASAVHTCTCIQCGITESHKDTINHFPDKKSGRGGWERRGALAGFYRTIIHHVLMIRTILGKY